MQSAHLVVFSGKGMISNPGRTKCVAEQLEVNTHLLLSGRLDVM